MTANGCPYPFYQDTVFSNAGFVDGRLCSKVTDQLTCCLPCPMTQWAYPDSFETMITAANWVAVVSTILCVFLLLSWIVLPVEKTHRHYLSLSLATAITFMNLAFVIPLAHHPEQCFDGITPHSMATSGSCAVTGFLVLFGGWSSVLWIFLRALFLHMQICWQVVVGRNFMWFSQAVGWGIPAIGITLAFTLSGVSYRFGQTCHINHKNSLADCWMPLLVFAAMTIIVQLGTFGYCIKVYLASLADNSASTEGSAMPSYSNSIRTLTPRQAYRRVRRVIALQWRGIVIVLIITADVIFFSVIFVFADNTVENVKADPIKSIPWIYCLLEHKGDKVPCLEKAKPLVVSMPTIGAVLVLLGMNGFWLALLLGRWSMVTGWLDLFAAVGNRGRSEFVSVDARLDDIKNDTRSYEMLSRESGKTMDTSVTPSVVTPVFPTYGRSPAGSANDSGNDGRRTPDYFGHTARYQTPTRSFSRPRPPQAVKWDAREMYAGQKSPQSPQSPQLPQLPPLPMSPQPPHVEKDGYINPLGMNRT